MSWEIIALIAIVAVVLISIPVLIIMWKISKRTLGTFDEIHKDMRRISFKEDPFEALDARVKKMTGPGSNPFGKV